MSDYREVARTLTDDLKLAMPPIAVSFADQAPQAVPRFEGNAPAGCQFWERAAQGAFVTSTADHELCAIGVHTHNLAEPSDTQAGELGEVLKVMAGLDYVTEEEAASIPSLSKPHPYVVYSPLSEAPLAPDVVLLFADDRQSLVITEAAQRVDKGVPPALGRPACAVVPQAINSGQAAISLGCCGARAYLDALSDGVSLWALPGAKLAEYAQVISTMAKANTTLQGFHQQRRRDVEKGERPTVQTSLQRM